MDKRDVVHCLDGKYMIHLVKKINETTANYRKSVTETHRRACLQLGSLKKTAN